jgi:uridylate kinase
VKPIYQRILLKISGEALQGENESGIDADTLTRVCNDIADIARLGVQVGVVVGAGNFVRGAELCAHGFDRVAADQMGMLATVINGLAFLDVFDRKNIPASIMSAIAVPGLARLFDRHKAKKELSKGKIVIFAGGTGNPLVTTDSTAALRGIEIGADIVLKATKVDGVYAADPVKNPKAKRYEKLTYNEVLEQRLGIMDLNAVVLCREHDLPLRVFNMSQPGAMQSIVTGGNVGTLIQSGE